MGWYFRAVRKSVEEAVAEGLNVSHAHFRHIYPLPKNTEKLLSSYKKIVVCELNDGQFAKFLKINFPHIPYLQKNKIQGLPFTITELKEEYSKILKEIK